VRAGTILRGEFFTGFPSRSSLTGGTSSAFVSPMTEWFSDPQIWISLFTLTALEIVLGIDNVIFISILAGKLPEENQAKARKLGLSLALVTRVLLLLSLTWIMGLTKPLFALPVLNQPISGRDLVLLIGGLFLIWKSVREVHEKLEDADGHATTGRAVASFAGVIVQILLLDIVFSLDSVITAVGMADNIGVMIAAVIIALGVMLAAAERISTFVNRHPTLKMLALSFLILIGVTLVAEGLGQHIPKGYIYFSMTFAFGVEILNLKLRSKQKTSKPVELHQPYR
jgi:predicted tellurium resistance membrane protein TerC